MFGSDFMYFSHPWELRAFQGTGKAIKSNMGEWLQDKCLVSTSQHSKRKLVGILREGAPKENPNKEKEREKLRKVESTKRQKRGQLHAAVGFEDLLQIWGQTQSLTFDFTVHISP